MVSSTSLHWDQPVSSSCSYHWHPCYLDPTALGLHLQYPTIFAWAASRSLPRHLHVIDFPDVLLTASSSKMPKPFQSPFHHIFYWQHARFLWYILTPIFFQTNSETVPDHVHLTRRHLSWQTSRDWPRFTTVKENWSYWCLINFRLASLVPCLRNPQLLCDILPLEG